MAALAERVQALQQRAVSGTSDGQRTTLERQIAARDNEIDRLIYKLYELTDGEIAVVEGNKSE